MAITKVTNSLVATNAIQGTLIADNAITSVHIAQNQVTSVQIPDSSITAVQLAGTSVGTGQLVNVSVTEAKIANNAVTSNKIATNSVVTETIAQNSITAVQIPDGSITDTQLGSGAFTMGTITTTGQIRGPASLTIDPATVGDNTGTVVIAGNLQVDGTTTTINSTQLSVADKKITVGKGSGSSSAANESGFEVGVGSDGASSNPSMLYAHSGTKFVINKPLDVTGTLITSGTLTINNVGSDKKLSFRRNGGKSFSIEHDNAGFYFYNETDSALHTRFTNGGAIGLGVNAPSAPLHVLGTAMVGVNDFGSYASNDANLLISNGDAGASILLYDDSTAYHSSVINYNSSVMTMALNTSNSSNSPHTASAINIIPTGVGIGTATPDHTLHVLSSSQSMVEFASSNASPKINFARSGAPTAFIQHHEPGASGTGSFRFATGSGHSPTVTMTISEDNKVGIGTDSPNEMLMVRQTSGTTMVKTEVAANSVVGFNIKKTGPTTQEWKIVDGQTVNGNLEIYDVTDSRSVMVFDGEGDIGMGVSPATHAKLTLGGTRASYSSVLAFDNNTTGGAEFFMLASDNTWSAGGGKFFMGHGSPGSSAIDVAIDGDGKVGIGTTSPSAVLSLIDPDLTATGTGLGGLRVHRPNAASQYGYFDYGYSGGGINLGSLYTGGGAANFGTMTFRQHSSTTSQVSLFIDSTGNAMIGKTAANTTAAGNIFFKYGRHGVTVNSTTCQIINRLGNDGTITLFEKDNAAIGQINVLSGRMGIGSGDTGLFFDSTRDCVAPFSMTANDGRSGIDLGRTGVKFKDAHFSGNVYVDGGLSVYQNGSTYRIASQSNETSATVNSYATLKTWKASQSGQFNTTFSAYIQSGSYYFRYRIYNVTKSAVVKMSNNSTDADHYFNANQTGNDGNVHNYQHYSLGLGKVDRGDVIAIQMQAADGSGNLANGNGQLGYARNWKILAAKTPAVERDTGVMERPQIYGASTHTQEVNSTGAIMHTVPVALNSGTNNIFHILDGFDQGTVGHASFEFTGLYAYAGANSSLGHMTTSIRRATNNSAWQVGAHTNHYETNGGGVSTPAFSWSTSGVLQCVVASSVQLTGVIRITTRTVPNYKWGIDI